MRSYFYLIGLLLLFSTTSWAQLLPKQDGLNIELFSQNPEFFDAGPVQTLATAVPLESYSYDWDEVNSEWVLLKHNYYAYDSVDFRRVEYLITNADTGVNETRWTYTYDAQGNRGLNQREIWVDSTSSWEINYGQNSTYQYDAAGNQTEWSRLKWSNGDWINDRRWFYTWISAGSDYILTEFHQEVWQVADQVWRNQSRTGYLYDADLNLSEKINYGWNDTDWFFINRTRDYTYNAENQKIGQFLDTWNADSSAWILKENTNYVRGDFGSYSYVTEEWTGTEFVTIRRVSYEYNPQGDRTRYALEDWNGTDYVYNFNNIYLLSYDADDNLLEYIHQKETGSTPLTNQSKVEYFNFLYLPVVGNVNEQELTGNFTSFPNPVNQQLNLEFDKEVEANLQILSLGGKVIQTQNQKGQLLSLNVQDLPSGMYLLHIQTTEGTFNQKFIKQ